MIARLAAGAAALAGLAAALHLPRGTAAPAAPADTTIAAASDWLAMLPDGEEKQRFIRDCTGCHGFGAPYSRPASGPRSEEAWVAAIGRMLGYAGPASNFRIIASDRDPVATAAWLVAHLDGREVVRQPRPAPSPAAIDEFMLPAPQDLPHDLAIDSRGHVIITGMFTHQMYDLDPATGGVGSVPIPVQGANPRALEIDAAGNWWVVLGNPGMLARRRASDGGWDTWSVGMYAHSLALGADGRVWYDGHFTRNPPQIGFVTAGSSTNTVIDLPRHPTLSDDPTGPVPYEIRVAPDGVVWTSELSGDRLIAHDPATGRQRVVEMPPGEMGPRRFDVDPDGVLWIPAYASGSLLRYDPAADRFTRHALPIADAAPYVVKVDAARGAIWIGTSSADALFRFTPADGSMDTYLLPSRGALVRHMAVDSRDGSVWLAYGASPGIASRVARVVPAD